jgi:hypothetical protein
MQKTICVIAAITFGIGITTVMAHAKGGPSASCMARAGFTAQQWHARSVSRAKASVYSACMAEHGESVVIRSRDGSIIEGRKAQVAKDLEFEKSHSSAKARHIRNDSPEAQACMRANGFTLDMWLAHRAGTQAQVAGYLACKNRLAARR